MLGLELGKNGDKAAGKVSPVKDKSTIKDIAAKMRKIDFCMMTTLTGDGQLVSRPMSTNGDVEYDGNSYLFSSDQQELVKELEKNPHVNLSFTGDRNLFISVAGMAELVHDREQMKAHWVEDLEQWFADGIDTPGIVMIRVRGSRAKYWQNWDSGEVLL